MMPFLLFFCLHLAPAPCLLNAVPLVPEAASAPTKQLSASAALAKVQSFYERNQHLRAQFRQVVENATFGKRTTSDGRVFIAKPGKMRWDYYGKQTRNRQRRVSRSFVSDGEGLYAVFHDTKQVFVKDMESDMLPVAITFLHGKGNFAADFAPPEFDTSGTYGEADDLVIKLTPKNANVQYKHLWLVVAPDNFRVRQSVVLNAKNDVSQFSFYEPNFTVPVEPSLFEVNHPDYELVDRNKPGSKRKGKGKRKKK